MANILDTKFLPKVITTVEQDAEGVEREVQKVAQVVHEVTFLDYQGTPHTLVAHPAGTVVSGEAEQGVRTIGINVPEYLYTDAEKFVQDYLDGKVL